MIPQNARPASASATHTKQSASGKVSASGGLKASDTRRGTYTPGRPAGVHARELGLKNS
jgi:hypothetical protein